MPEMQQVAQNITWATNDANPPSSSSTTAVSSASSPSPDHHSTPSSIPPWVHLGNNLHDQHHGTSHSSPTTLPTPSRPNTRHYKPPTHYRPGRKWDHFRTAEPALLGAPIADRQLEWESFMRSGPQQGTAIDAFGERRADSSYYTTSSSSAFPWKTSTTSAGGAVGRRVDNAWLEQNIPAVMRSWQEEDDRNPELVGRPALGGFKGVMYGGKWLISPERQERTVELFGKLLLKNAFVPAVFRIIVLAFATAALGIGVTIFENVRRVNRDADPRNQCDPRPSTYMAIIVGAVTIPYVCYVTWDEYTSKPLGLRSVAAKMLLILCDLYFIVFSASNVSLAFDALLDTSWACYDQTFEYIGDVKINTPQTCPNNKDICYKQRALSGVLIVSLVAWLLCFSISVLRVVEKLRPD